MNRLGLYITSGLLFVMLLFSTVFVVDQRQYGVVYQLGEIRQVVTDPGLNFKLPPPLQNVNYLDKRLLTLESNDTEPSLTAEKQRVVIDWYVRWKISDVTNYIRHVGITEKAGEMQLNRVVRNAFQQEVNKRTLKELLSTQREKLMTDVQAHVLRSLKEAQKPWGMDVIDVRITRVDYAASITNSAHQRMEAERKRVANELRFTGMAEGEKIRADADRQKEVILADAYKQAQTIKGQGDAESTRMYASAFGKDPAFAQFYRQLQAYRQTFDSKQDIVVLDANSEFLKSMRGSQFGR